MNLTTYIQLPMMWGCRVERLGPHGLCPQGLTHHLAYSLLLSVLRPLRSSTIHTYLGWCVPDGASGW